MRLLLFLPLCIALLQIAGCSYPADSPSEIPDHVRYSDNYKPPVFEVQDRIQKIREALDESHHLYRETAVSNNIPGLAYGVVVDDSLLFFGGYGRTNIESGLQVTEHSLFRIASMSKSFTAMAILKLRDEGKLSLSDPLFKYVPEFKQVTCLTADAPPVTLYNLMTMSAGFPEDNPWGDRFLDISDSALMELVAEGISFSTVPSLQYEYSNLGFGLLGHVISSVSGIPFQEYITENILHPLGMNHTYWEYSEVPGDLLAQGYRWEDGKWITEPLLHDGAFAAMGGLITSIIDFSKYLSFHLSAWPPRNDPDTGPVKRSTIREMHKLNNPFFYHDPNRFGNQSGPAIRGYGFGLWAMEDRDGILEVGHNGGLPGFGSSCMFYPQYGIGIMAFGNLTYVGELVRSANYGVIEKLIDHGAFSSRRMEVSEVLERRKEQVAQLILHWDPELEKAIVAANLYMDISREKRMNEAAYLLDMAGEIVSIGPLIPENQLRGQFELRGTKRLLNVNFTLTPESEPRVQWLTLELAGEK